MLAGGLTVPVETIMLALNLEERGFELRRDGEDTLVIQPHQQLTTDDCRQIRRWKRHLLALLDYLESPAVQ
jgi:hypothetical protein